LCLSSRPFGTIYNETSFAYQYENVLFVTVDIWYQEDPSEAINGDDTVKGAVEGEHLLWFESVLREARNFPEIIKHVFVQAHLPILWPIRRVSTNVTLMDGGSNNVLWKLMRQYHVDIYFCGDTHAHTVIKDPESNLIQIASRGMNFNSFLTVDVSHDTIDITSHNEIGENQQGYNYNYATNGRILIHKSGDNVHFDTSGELKFIDISGPLIHFDFETIVRLKDRPVTGLYQAGKLQPRKVMMGGIICKESLPNVGAFGQSYDAQVANLMLVNDGQHGKAGNFSEYSHVGVFGMGPHAGGNIVSYSLWFKTTTRNTILLSYKGRWNHNTFADLVIGPKGQIQFLYSPFSKLSGYTKGLNDNHWHHVIINMPSKNCLLSEITMFVNGSREYYKVIGNDNVIHFPDAGFVSLGGYGHSQRPEIKRMKNPFLGLLDEVSVWGRTLSWREIQKIMENPKLTDDSTESPSFLKSSTFMFLL